MRSSRPRDLFRSRGSRVLAVTLLVITLLILAAGCRGDGNAAESVATLLEGTWLGHEAGSTEEWSLLVRGEGFYLSGRGTWMRGRFELDAERGELDFIIGECDCPYADERALARFRLDGDSLHVAGLEPGRKERPASADGGGGARGFRFLRFVQTPESDAVK